VAIVSGLRPSPAIEPPERERDKGGISPGTLFKVAAEIAEFHLMEVRDALSKKEKAMTKCAFYVPLQAKPGKEKEVADFLRSAVPLVNAEPGTTSWFAIQEGPSSFAIFDTFDDEAGRDAHLNGKVAAALMEKAKAGDLFAKAPDIHKLEILAAKRPR
jgi:quinol monooxygenase YgiN